MPYLVLGFEEDIEWNGGGVTFQMIDTDMGQVIDVEGTVNMLGRRPPRRDELWTAARLLGKDTDAKVGLQAVREMRIKLAKAEKDQAEYRESAKRATMRSETLMKEIFELRAKKLDDEDMQIIATALEIRIEELAMANSLDEYVKTKDAYRKLTGRDWVDED